MKNAIPKITVFAIVLFCCQVAFAQTAKVVCYDYNSWYQEVWIDAPYFNADLIAESGIDDACCSDATAEVSWEHNSYYSTCGFSNIGRQDAGGMNVGVSCSTSSYGAYAVAEAWAEW